VTGFQSAYTSGDYLKKNPLWHVDESPWKARQVLRMLGRNNIAPRTICDVGCGAGDVLKQLQSKMGGDCRFWGYDISPQAIELCQARANERLHFEVKDVTTETNLHFDLVLVMDVIEHLEDCFAFLRSIQGIGRHTVFHVPLDISVQTVLRSNGLIKTRDAYGHIQYFTKETSLRTLQDLGYLVLDSFYTARAIEIPSAQLSRNLMRLPRKLLFSVQQDLAARLLGGYSLLVLTRG
jgi:ubiquinone/menaquinone biosynthesis C-methylase UbiE